MAISDMAINSYNNDMAISDIAINGYDGKMVTNGYNTDMALYGYDGNRAVNGYKWCGHIWLWWQQCYKWL